MPTEVILLLQGENSDSRILTDKNKEFRIDKDTIIIVGDNDTQTFISRQRLHKAGWQEGDPEHLKPLYETLKNSTEEQVLEIPLNNDRKDSQKLIVKRRPQNDA